MIIVNKLCLFKQNLRKITKQLGTPLSLRGACDSYFTN